MQTKVVGSYQQLFAADAELLHIRLHKRPHWAAAHELSQYVSRYLDADLQRQCGAANAAQTMAADIAYAVSELMENAAKYSMSGAVELQATLHDDDVMVSLSHAVATAHAERYCMRAVDLCEHDPLELLMATVEHNAANAGEGGSGLGLLSLMSDYGARLGWAFEPLANASSVRVTTQVRLPLRH
jgi:hypothetical protein